MIMRIQERILPGEVIWQFPTNLLSRLDHFDAPVAPAKIVRRREAVLISVRIGCGRVPPLSQSSAAEIAIYIGNNLGCLVGLRFCADREILHGQSNPPVFMFLEYVLLFRPN